MMMMSTINLTRSCVQCYLVRTLIVDTFEYIDLALYRDVMRILECIFSSGGMNIPRWANRGRPSKRQAMCYFATFSGGRGRRQEKAMTHPQPSGMCLILNLNTLEG